MEEAGKNYIIPETETQSRDTAKVRLFAALKKAGYWFTAGDFVYGRVNIHTSHADRRLIGEINDRTASTLRTQDPEGARKLEEFLSEFDLK